MDARGEESSGVETVSIHPSESKEPSDSPSLDSSSQHALIPGHLLQDLARDLASELESQRCHGVSRADILKHIRDSGLLRDLELDARKLIRNIPTYSKDLQQQIETQATGGNPVSRFFAKRAIFKQFLADRREFLERSVQDLERQGLIKRHIHNVMIAQRHAPPPGTLAIALFGVTRLGKMVLKEVVRSQKEETG